MTPDTVDVTWALRILELTADASPSLVRKTFRRVVVANDPEKFSSMPEKLMAAQTYNEARRAYSILKNAPYPFVTLTSQPASSPVNSGLILPRTTEPEVKAEESFEPPPPPPSPPPSTPLPILEKTEPRPSQTIPKAPPPSEIEVVPTRKPDQWIARSTMDDFIIPNTTGPEVKPPPPMPFIKSIDWDSLLPFFWMGLSVITLIVVMYKVTWREQGGPVRSTELLMQPVVKPETENEKAVKNLVKDLKYGNSLVKSEALKNILALGEQQKIAVPLIREVYDYGHEDAQVWAAIALARIGQIPDNSLPIFMLGLKHESTEVRSYSARYIGEIGKQVRDTIPRLRHLLKDSDRQVRKEARAALEAINAEK